MKSGYGCDPAAHRAMFDDAPLARSTRTEDIAETILFLSSDSGSLVTIDIITIDGSETI